MRNWLMIMMGAWLALAAPADGAEPEDAPIPREYARRSPVIADKDKPADQQAAEKSIADSAEAACLSAGHPPIGAACTALGRAYRTGEGRPQNRPVAELLFRKACNAADGDGCYELGALFLQTAEPDDVLIANSLFARACGMASFDGCHAQADNLATGAIGQPDALAAEALYRDTCTRGGRRACRTLARLLMAAERREGDWQEGSALLDRLCRASDAEACSDATHYWGQFTGDPATAAAIEYRQLGCAADDAWLCHSIGETELRRVAVPGPAERTTALPWFEQACRLNSAACAAANELNAEPQLSAACAAGDAAACLSLGQMVARGGSVLFDEARALALFGAQCIAEPSALPKPVQAQACLEAADLALAQSERTGSDQPGPGGTDPRADPRADPLRRDETMTQVLDRAGSLMAERCDSGDRQACLFLTRLALGDPAAPLMLASAEFAPELTPEEQEQEAEQARREREEERRREREEYERSCTITTVVFEGQSYSDKLCPGVVRATNGFSVKRGAAPWQALIWRPATVGRSLLSPQDRVWCGGSVIREGWVLTAAHCLVDKDVSNKSIKTAGHTIRLGLTNALGDEGFTYPIIETYRHPDYTGFPTTGLPKLAFDIALVRYDPKRGKRGSNAQAPARIRLDAVPLEQRRIEAIPRASVYGWGLTAFQGGVIPDGLRGARVKLRDRTACTNITKLTDIWRDSVLCADELKGDEGGQACGGDSGGPLITYSDPDKIPTLIGVVSSGFDCGTAGLPSRYIRVAHPRVQKWLRETLPPSRPR